MEIKEKSRGEGAWNLCRGGESVGLNDVTRPMKTV